MSTASARHARTVLLLTVFLQLLGFGIVLPLLPYYGRDLGAGGLAVGVLFAAYSLTQFLLAPLWGAVADHVGRRPVLLACIAWACVAYVLFAVARSYEMLLLSRVIAGLSAAVIGVAQAYVVDRTPPDRRAGALGMLGAALGVGFVVGPAVGALLSRWGFAAAGWFAACLSTANLLFAVRWLPESLAVDGRTPALSLSWWQVPSGRGVRAVLAILFLSTAGYAVLYPVLPLFVGERFDLGPLEAGLLFSVIGLLAAAVQGGALGRLARAVGERPLLARGAVVMAAGLLALPLAPSVPWMVAVLVVMALGGALVTPLAQTLLSRLTRESAQAGALSAGHASASLARACGPALGGFLYEHAHPSAAFVAAALLLLAAAMLTRTIPDAGVGGSPPSAAVDRTRAAAA